MNRYDHIIEKLEPRRLYTYKEILAIISPQSSTASYILMDLLSAGRVQEMAGWKYRLNQ